MDADTRQGEAVTGSGFPEHLRSKQLILTPPPTLQIRFKQGHSPPPLQVHRKTRPPRIRGSAEVTIFAAEVQSYRRVSAGAKSA